MMPRRIVVDCKPVESFLGTLANLFQQAGLFKNLLNRMGRGNVITERYRPTGNPVPDIFACTRNIPGHARNTKFQGFDNHER